MRLALILIFCSILGYGQNVKISEMPSATSLTGSEYVPIVQTTNKKATISLIRGFGSYGTSGQLMRVNGSANGLEFFTPDFVQTSGSYSNPSWISSLAWSKITGASPSWASITGKPNFDSLYWKTADTTTTVSSVYIQMGDSIVNVAGESIGGFGQDNIDYCTYPIQVGSLVVYGSSGTWTDNGAGSFTGAGFVSGYIDYAEGCFQITVSTTQTEFTADYIGLQATHINIDGTRFDKGGSITTNAVIGSGSSDFRIGSGGINLGNNAGNFEIRLYHNFDFGLAPQLSVDASFNDGFSFRTSNFGFYGHHNIVSGKYNIFDVSLGASSVFKIEQATAAFDATRYITLNLGSDATGDIYYRGSDGYFKRLGVGTNGHVLTLASGIPSWAAPSGGGATNLSFTGSATNGTVNSDTGTDATIPLGNGTNSGLSLNDYTTAEKSKLAGISGTNTGDVSLAGTPDYITISGQTITRGLVDLATDITGDLPFANLTQGSALSVLGVTGNATADVASIAAGTDGHVLRRSGTTLGFGTLASGAFASNTVSRAALVNGSALSVIGRSANSSGAVADISAGTDGHVLFRSGTTLTFGTLPSASITDGTLVNADINASAAIDATKLIDGSITNTELGYINTLSSNAQTQLTARELLTNKATALTTMNNDLYPTTQSLFQDRTVTTADAIVQSDNGKTIYFNSASAMNFTIDQLTIRSQVSFVNIGAGEVTFVNGTGVTIDGSVTLAGAAGSVRPSGYITYRSATAPIIQTSGGSDIAVIKQKKVSLSSSDILSLYSSGKLLLAAPGSGKANEILSMTLKYNYSTAAYATNTTLSVLYSTVEVTTHAGLINQTSNKIKIASAGINYLGDTSVIENQAVYLSTQTGDPTAGGGSLEVYITYRIIDL